MSFSRVSAITGLHRHVVSDIVNSADAAEPASDDESAYRRNRLARVLRAWYEDPGYTDDEGRPRRLPFDGPAPSFVALARDFGGDIYPRIILEELVEVGAAEIQEDGRIHAIARRYSAGGAEPADIEHLGTTAHDVFTTLEHNLVAAPEARHYDDSVVAVALDRAALPLFRRLLRQRGAAFLEDIEGWVSEHEKPAGTPNTVRAGVIVQMLADADSSEDREKGKLREL